MEHPENSQVAHQYTSYMQSVCFSLSLRVGGSLAATLLNRQQNAALARKFKSKGA